MSEPATHYAYAKHGDLDRWKELGWQPTGSLEGTHHGQYADLVEYKGDGTPLTPDQAQQIADNSWARAADEDYKNALAEKNDDCGDAGCCDDNPKTISAGTIAETAAALVGGDRHKTHGDKLDNHNAIAEMWMGYFKASGIDVLVDAHDVAVMMALLKIARTINGNFNLDDYVDIAGYAACAGEIAQRGGKYEPL